MRAYARDDGLYDVEARLVDIKPYAHLRITSGDRWPANQPLHDLCIRLAVDDQLVVREIQASSDVTPFGICKEAERTLSVLIGERIARGWSSIVKERLRGAASCTHLMEMLIPMGTTALQGIGGLRNEQDPDPAKRVHKIDSCYAFASDREIVQRVWPKHYRPPEKK